MLLTSDKKVDPGNPGLSRMGCTSSKHRSGRDRLNASYSRSLSLPDATRLDAQEGPTNSFVSGIHCRSRLQVSCPSKLRPVEEEGLEPEAQAGSGAALNGSEDTHIGLPESLHDRRKRKLYERSATFHSSQNDAEASAWGEEEEEENMSGRDRTMPTLSYRLSKSFASEEFTHGFTGLRLLLSPVATPKHGFMPSTRRAALSKSISSNGRSSLRTLTLPTRPPDTGTIISKPEEVKTEDELAEPGSPLFDPSLLATFEKALETSDDSWLSVDVSSSSSRNTSSETCSDADSPEWPRAKEDVHRENCYGFYGPRFVGEEDQLRGERCASKAVPFLNSSACDGKFEKWTKLEYLEQFEFKGPPGCEEKIVLYFTSLRGIRKTFEDCCTLRMILKGFGVHVDERDVWMHSKFRQELTDILGETLPVPRLFIKGRYIGGANEVKQLHEDGVLAQLLEGLPCDRNDVCDLCGGVRFIPCSTCGGSCKMISADEVVARCPDCNENGLSMCPSCGW